MRVVQSINKLQFVACNNFKVSFRFFFPSDKRLEKLDLVVCCDHDLKREESEFGPEFHLRGKRKQTETVFPIFPLAIYLHKREIRKMRWRLIKLHFQQTKNA